MTLKPVPLPLLRLSGLEVAPVSANHEALQPVLDVLVELVEFPGRVSGTKVVAPSSEHRVQGVHKHPDVLRAVLPWVGQFVHPCPHPFHAALRGPSLKVVAAFPPLLPQLPRHPHVQVTTKEVESFLPLGQLYLSRLLRVQRELQSLEDD